MQPYRNGQHEGTLQVLLIEHEPAVLNRTAALLLAEGCDITTARTADGLTDRVERLLPDLILMDVLLPELDTRELGRIAARCRGGPEPVLVLHTKLLRPMLRRVLDVRTIFGIIPKSDDDALFTRLFHDLCERLKSEMPTQIFAPRPLTIATSGTYAAATSTPANGPRALKHG